jgi:hypothetical protein
MSKLLILVGVVLIVMGLFWPLIQNIGFGHLPGDIVVKKEGFRFYFPITTCIIISIIISVMLWFFRK